MYTMNLLLFCLVLHIGLTVLQKYRFDSHIARTPRAVCPLQILPDLVIASALSCIADIRDGSVSPSTRLGVFGVRPYVTMNFRISDT